MVTDEELIEISHEIDDLLLKMIQTHDIEPINLSSIMLARLIRMNESANSDEHFYRLLSDVPSWREKINDMTLQ